MPNMKISGAPSFTSSDFDATWQEQAKKWNSNSTANDNIGALTCVAIRCVLYRALLNIIYIPSDTSLESMPTQKRTANQPAAKIRILSIYLIVNIQWIQKLKKYTFYWEQKTLGKLHIYIYRKSGVLSLIHLRFIIIPLYILTY